MYDLTKIHSALSHLQNISPTMFQDKGSHYMMFCQFCNDATRKPNPAHGHLYVSKELPVFYCQRCGKAGTILNLLISTGFNDEECLEFISSFLKYKFTKDHYKQIEKKKKTKKISLRDHFVEEIKKVKKEEPKNYDVFLNYLHNRVGTFDYLFFLLTPGYVSIKTKYNSFLNFFSCKFNNTQGEFSTARIIEQNEYFRFKNSGKDNLYFFQDLDFENQKSIVLTEGPFDIINTYLYNNTFNNNQTFFASVNGKKFLSSIEKLVMQELLIGNYEINIIFDNDDFQYLKTLNKTRSLIKNLNNNIIIRGWLPSLANSAKDVSDFPSLIEI